MKKKYKWVQKYEDEIAECNTGSPDRKKRMMKHYAEKGYCEMEMWCLATAVSKFVLPRLTEFRDVIVKNGPQNYQPIEVYDAMIYSFQKIVDGDHMYVDKKERRKIDNGLQLFAKYMIGMWC